MENSFQTSFIPKKPITTNGVGQSSVKSATSITVVVSVFIIIVICVSAAGLYLYKNYYLVKNKEALSANLFKIRDSFDRDAIASLELYDKRASVAREVLSNHVVLSPLFESLNELSLSTIQYTKFDHKTTNGVFSVKMSGIARDYKSIALQADVFNSKKGSMFKDVIFSNLTKDKNNFVTFDVEFNVNPELLAYTNNITNIKIEPEKDIANDSVVTPEIVSATPLDDSSKSTVTPIPSTGAPTTNTGGDTTKSLQASTTTQ